MNLLTSRVFIFEDVEQADKCLIVDELSQKRDLSHSRVIDPICHVLSTESINIRAQSLDDIAHRDKERSSKAETIVIESLPRI